MARQIFCRFHKVQYSCPCCCAQLSILLCLMDIAAGMSYLHSIGLLHSDLKGGNVLLKSCAPSKSDPRGFVCKVWAWLSSTHAPLHPSFYRASINSAESWQKC